MLATLFVFMMLPWVHRDKPKDYEVLYRITYTWEGTEDMVVYEWFSLPDGNYPEGPK